MFMVGIFFLIQLVSAEQVVWNNDSDIQIQDNWKDIDGTPLTGATCSWVVYNTDFTVNQSGTHTEIAPGVFNFTISQLIVVDIYPMIFNCTKNDYNGTSTKDSLRIVDEITEDFKDNLEEINITVDEINTTTHLTYDLLVDDINNTLNIILNTTNLTNANLSNINNDLDTILANSDLLVQKWGSVKAREIISDIKDLKRTITTLEYRIGFVPGKTLSDLTLSAYTQAKETQTDIDGLTQEDKEKFSKFWKWAIPIGIVIIILIILILIINKLSKKRIGFKIPPKR